MTDTARDKAYALATLFANNTSGDITPQDMRDFVESVVAWIGGSTYPRPLRNQVVGWYDLNGGTSKEILNVAGAGTVKKIWYTVDHRDRQLYFDFYFNGEGTPASDTGYSISLKADDFIFCRGLGALDHNYWHQYFGRTYSHTDAAGQQAGYLALPMPYQNGCIIKCRNTSGSGVKLFSSVDYSYGVDLTSDRRGKLCVQYTDAVVMPAAYGSANAAVTTTTTTLIDSRAPFVASAWIGYTVCCNSKTMVITGNTTTTLTGAAWVTAGAPGDGYAYQVVKEHTLLNVTSKRGELVGLWLYMGSYIGANLEGNLGFYVDGESTPSFQSTGTEDFFFGAWYFEDEYPPTTLGLDVGVLAKTPLSVYRWFLNDRMPFETSLRIGWPNGEAGVADCCPVTVTCVVFYYVDDGATP